MSMGTSVWGVQCEEEPRPLNAPAPLFRGGAAAREDFLQHCAFGRCHAEAMRDKIEQLYAGNCSRELLEELYTPDVHFDDPISLITCVGSFCGCLLEAYFCISRMVMVIHIAQKP